MVDLPAPEGPTMAQLVPAGMSRSSPDRISRPVVTETHVLERTAPLRDRERRRVGLVDDLGRRVDQVDIASMSISPWRIER